MKRKRPFEQRSFRGRFLFLRRVVLEHNAFFVEGAVLLGEHEVCDVLCMRKGRL